jgi:non-specific serine/threonine protein kinase/serine/threonine-protein kinase
VERLYQLVVDLPSAERQAALKQHCGGDEEIHAEVLTLLEHYREARSAFMTRPIFAGARGFEVEERIGPYRPRDVLGEGGMGVVYLASQSEPLQRDVALKVLKLGMDSSEVLRRFDAERQALALMDHPNIARVYDAGTTEQGRPYFAMEYVPGLPITDFCDNQRLAIADRLRLFVNVCGAVQHAHQKGVIHRDLKPSNVLVAVKDGVPIPKVIDFGVAKAIGPQLTEQSIHTRIGQLIGTPDYMSPEQADLRLEDVDTRTDVYSLGVLLYEMLTSELPHDPTALRREGLAEMLDTIRTTVPPRPSARVRSLGGRAVVVATDRSTQTGPLVRRLQTDLDWIVLKAIEKDRSRRYGSPYELADDLRRHLSDQPVQARPPTLGYRTGKFVRRHTLGVGVAAVGLSLLVAFVAALVVQNQRIVRERDRANRQAAVALGVTDYLTDLFRVSDPSQRGSQVTAREIMEQGALRLDRDLAEEPIVHARLQTTLGEVYTNLALYPRAEEFLTEASRRLTELLGAESEEALAAASALGRLHLLQGRFAEAESVLTSTLEVERRVLGEEHELTLETLQNVGKLAFELRRLPESERVLKRVVETRERTLGRTHPKTMLALSDLGLVLWADSRLEEAESIFREVVEHHRTEFGEGHMNTLLALSSLANVYVEQGRLDEAVSLLEETYDALREELGDEHPSTLMVGGNLAVTLGETGEIERALALMEGLMPVDRRVLGNEHPLTLAALNGLAGLLSSAGRIDEAEPLYREALEGKRRTVGDEHLETITASGNLATNFVHQGRIEEAEPMLAENVRTSRRLLPANHPVLASRIANLGVVKRNLGRYAEADSLLREALEIRRATLGEDHPSTLTSFASLGRTRQLMGDAESAEEFLRRAAEGRVRALGVAHPSASRSTRALASFYADEGRWDEAEEVLGTLLAAQSRELGADDPRTVETRETLASIEATREGRK